ncbi:MAG TPA: 2-oxo-tetronate isomerase [Beutenbergiaceae bacterium]|nr:2-oxo-tetronate isomerase [Beutenbergiaceae bacterium]
MVKFAANLTTMFTETEFLDRFRLASQAGFDAVEYLFPYDYAPNDLRHLLDQHGLQQVLFNAPAGNWEAGERGLASLADREEEFTRSIELALQYAQALDCPTIHVMAGIAPAEAAPMYKQRIAYAAQKAARVGKKVSIEPINTKDMPGYFLDSVFQAVDFIKDIGALNVGLQLDFYHAQITHGDLTALLNEVFEWVIHIQIAAVPNRNEPDRGEINYTYLFQQLQSLGYQGWIGCEYFPETTTTQGLGWMSSLQPHRNEEK